MNSTLGDVQSQALAARLADFVEQHLPLARAMHIDIAAYDGNTLVLSAPLAYNNNDKLTAFGGSLYCLAVMSCWGCVYLRCLNEQIALPAPDIVVTGASIKYTAPVTASTIEARCDSSEVDWEAFAARYAERGVARVTLGAEVIDGGKTAVEFSGDYALIGTREA